MFNMNINILRRLQKLNQLKLTAAEESDVLAFFKKQRAEMETLCKINTESVERMVHVMPILTVVRDDVVVKKFTREELQAGAPETMDGYWQVPRLVE